MPIPPRIAFAAALAASVTAPGSAAAQCLPRERLVETLETAYSEELTGHGLRGEVALFELFRSETGGTWTILRTSPGGMSCIVAAGEGWLDRSEEAFEPAEVES